MTALSCTPRAARAHRLVRTGLLLAALALAFACGGEESEAPAPGGETGGTPAPEAPAPEPAAEAEPEPSPGGAEETASEGGISDAARKEAEQIFATRCTTCHGPKGRGDGPASQGLDPQPRNFHKSEWQQSVTDEHIEKIIMYGGAAVGKSAAMPANPDLSGKPEVVDALRAHIRELGES